MPYYVYRYIDKSDGVIKYIGKTRSLKKRISSHKNDSWANGSDWKVEYIKLQTHSQADAYESHLISFHKTYKWYNKAKSDWGVIPEFKGIKYDWITLINEYTNHINTKKELEVCGFYETLNAIKGIIDECIIKQSEWGIIIRPKNAYTYSIDDYIYFIAKYLSFDSVSELSENLHFEITNYGGKISSTLKFENGGKIHLILANEITKNEVGRFLRENITESLNDTEWSVYNKVKHIMVTGILECKSAELEWTKGIIPIISLTVFARPDSYQIQEKLMRGEIVKDKNNNLYFQRRATDRIADIKGGIAFVIPYGQKLESYINADLSKIEYFSYPSCKDGGSIKNSCIKNCEKYYCQKVFEYMREKA